MTLDEFYKRLSVQKNAQSPNLISPDFNTDEMSNTIRNIQANRNMQNNQSNVNKIISNNPNVREVLRAPISQTINKKVGIDVNNLQHKNNIFEDLGNLGKNAWNGIKSTGYNIVNSFPKLFNAMDEAINGGTPEEYYGKVLLKDLNTLGVDGSNMSIDERVNTLKDIWGSAHIDKYRAKYTEKSDLESAYNKVLSKTDYDISNMTFEEKELLLKKLASDEIFDSMGYSKYKGNNDFDALMSEENIEKVDNKLRSIDEDITRNIENTNNPILKKGAELAPSIASNATTGALSLINPAIGTTAFSASAMNSYARQGKEELGLSDSASVLYGTVLAGMESVTEGFELSKFSKATKGLARAQGKNQIKEAVKDYLMNIGTNYIQEAMMEPIQETTNQVFAGESNWDNMLGRMNESGINGALSSAVLDLGSSVVAGGVNVASKINNKSQENIRTQVFDKINNNELFDKNTRETLINSINNLDKNNLNNLNTYLDNAIEIINKLDNKEASNEIQNRLNELKKIDTSNMGLIEKTNIKREIRALESGYTNVEDYRKAEEFKSKQAKLDYDERQKNKVVSVGENTNIDYRMQHRPTRNGVGYDITSTDSIGKDIYTNPENYVDMSLKHNQESYNALINIKDNPNVEITIYRASPKNELNEGDWITLSRSYAEMEAQKENVPVNEFKVKAKDIQFAGDDINEFGYFPQENKKIIPMSESGKNKINDMPPMTNEQLKNTFERNVDNALSNKSSKRNTILGKVKSNIALKIKDILGIDVSNRTHRLSDYDIRHIMNQHSDASKEATKGQVAITSEDIKKIPYIIEDPSDIVKGTDNKLGETIRYIKKYDDNTTFVVEVVPENSNDLIIKTMWKKPSTLTNIENNPSSTSKTKGSDISSTINNIIPSEQNYVNNTKKTMNPIEIANLDKEDISSTPKIEYTAPTLNGNKKSSFYKNITNNSKFLNKELRSALKTDADIEYYKGITNEETLTKAMKKLADGGEIETIRWANKDKDFTPEDVSEGWILLKRYQDVGDYDSAIQIARKMRNIATNAGQTVQAFGIMNRLTPEGMTMYVQSELDEAFEKFSESKTKKWIDENKSKFQLTADETQFIVDKVKEAQGYEKNSYEQKVALAEIQKVMTDKLPPERGQKIKSWMRISMLFNPKTQVRNVAGNAIIAPVNYAGDIISSIADKVISKKTGVRTIGTANIKAILKGLKKGATEATNDFKKGINTKSIDGNRFEIGQGKSFSENNLIGKSLNRVESTLNYVMDVGDRVFSESWFENSLQNQMILNNTTEVTQEMIDIATQEALSRTWNDNNNYTKFVLNIRKGMNKLNINGYGLGDILIPFAKTPANLTKAIVDYSPIGLVNSLKDGINLKNSIEKGTNIAIQQHQFVQNLGKAVAGTLLYIAGYALAKAGITTGDNDDDKDVANFMKNTLGVSSYSIKIGDKTFTYDWAQPISAPLSIMADIVKQEDSDAELYDKILNVIDTPLNNIMEQSFMSSIQSVLNNRDNVTKGLAEAIEDLPSRAIPTFVKQIADLVDDTQRQTYVRGKPIETAVNKMKAKIPIVSKTLAPTVDTLGRESKKFGGNNGVFNVFFNPANFNTGLTTKSAEEIYKLYKQTGDKTIMPRVAGYSLTYKGKNYNLSTEERAKYQKVMGKYVNDNVEKLLSSKDYKKLSDVQKAEIINEIVSDGAELAKEDYANTYNMKNKNSKEKIEYERSKSDVKVDEEIKKGLSTANAYIYKTIISKKESDKDEADKTISNSSTKNKLKYIMDMEIDDSQKQHLINVSTNDVDYNVSVKDLKKLNGEYLTYLQQSGNKPEKGGMTAREEYMQLINTGIPVKQLNKYYSEKGDIEGVKDSSGKTISGSKKQAMFNYVNSLSLSIPQKQILLARENESFAKLYYDDIINYINNLNISNTEKSKMYDAIFKKIK